MATNMNQDRNLKRKLLNFLQELQHFGTVKGFRHFHCYVRSKEELLLTVNNRAQGNSLFQGNSLSLPGDLSRPASRKPSLCPNDRSSVSSDSRQVDRGGLRDEDVYLPPASPCEDSTPDTDVTVLLIAGYARYACPYVWVRSNHEWLLQLKSRVYTDRDNPLKLQTTVNWKDEDVQVTDVVAEVVALCTYPPPWNPFEIDLQYFQSLPQPDQFLCSAAMMACLQKIMIHTPESKSYTAKVFDDLQRIAQFHFISLRKMAPSIPILQQNSPQSHQENLQRHQKEQQQQHQHSQQHQQTHSPRARYPRVTASMPVSQSPATASPSNPFSASRVIYGHGFDGSFPGSFNRTPAPSLI